MRGEHTSTLRRLRTAAGSSPHARGTLQLSQPHRMWSRFIPACAGNTVPRGGRAGRRAVHPRMRGEHEKAVIEARKASGSSPHARGTRFRLIGGSRTGRFIPACAGNTIAYAATSRPSPVHPRMRGEHVMHARVCERVAGSSPHARGTHLVFFLFSSKGRFIPACAGNTSRSRSCLRLCTVHPRMRGEHVLAQVRSGARYGSSPHARGTQRLRQRQRIRSRFIPACAGNTMLAVMIRSAPYGSSPHARGTPGHYLDSVLTRRFIPACAGNTLSDRARFMPSSVHPRMRGEHQRMSPGQGRVAGSSPHARGTQAMIISFRHKGRFIPACAGNTAPPRGRCTREPVHPRMRGEHTCNACRLCCPRGSSPHARGTRFAHAANGSPCRFIPACAGNTFIFEKLFVRHTVHPRMRGEHAGPCWTASGRCGSSPHARGTPSRWIASAASARFIPACAGNTRCCPRVEPPTPVHPRMRGEHGSRLAQRPRSGGSSPHARGTLSWRKTLALSITVHPRMRGEHAALPHQIFLIFGSSPHARGTRG
ncbi:hypothetical protein J2T35_002212 [Kerstersia gyiorum]|nr:hypothetical protein [Kerstersia gyiorum]